jgi:single-strand DNA-binding protein
MNVWNFTGNLGNDAEQRFTADGKSIVSFSVGVKCGYGDKATTTWARCNMFGKSGEGVFPYLKKGILVGVSGEAAMREWQDKEGQKRTNLEVRVNDLSLLSKKESGGDNRSAPAKERQKPAPDDLGDDIPF